MRRSPLLVLALGLSLAAPAPAYQPAESVPALCAGDLFADLIGTRHVDLLEGADRRPSRLWGLGGDDVLLGAVQRASCLMGGSGRDDLRLGDGGGVAFGEAGKDRIHGGSRDDVLSGAGAGDRLFGNGGNDVLLGGRGADLLVGGDGDDTVEAAGDGTRDRIVCGPGRDRVTADPADRVDGCEAVIRRR